MAVNIILLLFIADAVSEQHNESLKPCRMFLDKRTDRIVLHNISWTLLLKKE